MKIIALPDGVINRKDRAQWLTPIFDAAFVTTLFAPTRLLSALAAVNTTFAANARVDTTFQASASDL